MKDSEGVIIYISKAKEPARKRVTSYFRRHDPNLGWKTSRLVDRIADIDFVVTDNEIEAFLLESKSHQALQASLQHRVEGSATLYLSENNGRSISPSPCRPTQQGRKFTGPKAESMGRLLQMSSKYLTVGLLRKLFKIRICNRLPKTPCLQCFIKNCEAPCIANVMREQYMINIVALQGILEGKKSTIDKFAEEMHAEMKRASELGDYERAKRSVILCTG